MSITVAGVPDSIKMTKDDAVYSYTLENDELAKIGESITISKITYDGKDYGIASGTTVEIDKAVSLIASGSAITLPIDKEQYKSYTFKVDTSDGLKLTVTAVKAEFTLYMVGAPNYTTTNVFTEMTKLDVGFLGYTFKYNTAMSDNWGSPSTGVAFKLALGNNVWDGAYGGFTLTVDGDYIEAEAGSSDNGSVDNLADGITYIVRAKYEADKVFVKIEKKN